MYEIDLGGIYRETRDFQNDEVKKTVEELYLHHYRHGADRAKWHQLSQSKQPNPSAKQPTNIPRFDRHFIKELEAGRYIVDARVPVRCRIPFFIKDEGNGKYRFIPDYSHPKTGTSVNSLVAENEGKVELNDKIELINYAFDNGTTRYLGKNDFKSWYRQLPMAQSDWSISVYHWRGIDFVDTRMPWGSTRASKFAHHMSIAITYIAYKYIPRPLLPCWFNYIDDHITRAPTKITCLYIHITYILICTKYGIQLNIKKTVLYARTLTGLGIELNVEVYEAAVTDVRATHITHHLEHLQQRQTVTAKYAQQVAGKLEDIAFMLYPLRVYLRYLRNEIPPYLAPNQTVTITPQIQNMCTHWIRALKYIKRRKMKHILELPPLHQHQCYTDASNKGYGIFYHTHWTYGGFFDDEIASGETNNIREREFFPILITALTFGPYWTGTQVVIRCDNKNVCDAITYKDIRNETAHHLLVRICEAMMKYKFEFKIEYIPTDENCFADALSRLHISTFQQLCTENNVEIDPAPMLHERPPFEIGRIYHRTFPTVQLD